MALEFFWRLPVDGDGRSLRKDLWNRGDYNRLHTHRRAFARTGPHRDGYRYFDHLSQIARAAELAGFTGLSIPQSAAGEEPLIVAGAAAREVRRLTLLPSLPAHFLSAVYAAKIAVSFQRLTSGRLAWHLVTEAPETGAWHGHTWSVAEQIARTDEFLDVAKGFWTAAPFTYRGRYCEVENGGFAGAFSDQPFPVVYLSGDTAEALALSAKHADVHILSLDTPEAIRSRIATLDALAAGQGRTLRYALQAEVVARHSDEAAWKHIRHLWDQAGEKTVPLSGAAIPPGDPQILTVGRNFWSGLDFIRPGKTAGLVGSYDALADRFAEYHELGIDSFILAAQPHLEEAYRIGEQLLPLIGDRAGSIGARAA
ncbi:MAG: class flavin-dependent oxidoreductase [Rhodospirillales bacterium]|nr:class flavin-dependent oxidoreductase [Rhodospirillales bacterium]